jgi:site-specific DNA recombinase
MKTAHTRLARRSATANAPVALATAGYVRVSTDEQAREGLSLAMQEERIRSYCLLRGLELTAIYCDAGVSAGKPLSQRPEGARLLEALDAGDVSNVVGIKLDRLFRNAVDCLQTSSAWERAGVALHLIDLGGQAIDTRSAVGQFFLTVMAGAAEMERNLIRERTRSALEHKRGNGERLGATPLGFVTPEAGAPMEPVAEEMEAVRLILMRRRGRRKATYRAIAAELTDRGYRTKRGRQWHASTVRAIWGRRDRYDRLLLSEDSIASRTGSYDSGRALTG